MVYSLRERTANISQYRLLVYARSVGTALQQALLKIARGNPNVLAFYENLGAWDYELEIEMEDPKLAVDLRQMLQATLGEKIASTRLHQLFQYYKSSNRVVYDE